MSHAHTESRYARVLRVEVDHLGRRELVHYTRILGVRASHTQGGVQADLYPDGRMVVPDGFPFDGATGVPDTPRNSQAAGLHDALCGMIRNGSLPWRRLWAANRVFHERMLIDREHWLWALIQRLGTDVLTGPWLLGGFVLSSIFRKTKK